MIKKLFVFCLALSTLGCSASTEKKATGTESATTVSKTNPDDDVAFTEADAAKAENKYKEVSYPTPNYDKEKVNTVEGVILHHTAEPTVQRSLFVLTKGPRKVGTHVVIDTDGTRYVMCSPETVTWHAGASILNGKEGCNFFTIGIEFQGNTLEKPLTDDQIRSAIEYLRPIIAKYHIPTKNIVTHKQIREAYRAKYPNSKVYGKVDITDEEYQHFMRIFKEETKKK